jgi:hypothetical protein
MVATSEGISHLARNVLTLESARLKSPGDEMDRAVRAFERLRTSLTKLAGSAGFAILLGRAVALAIVKDPSLKPLGVGIDGSLTGVDEVRRGLNGSHVAHHGGEIVLAELLGLLVSFIGEPLTLTLVREAWPNASMDPVANPTAPASSKEIP